MPYSLGISASVTDSFTVLLSFTRCPANFANISLAVWIYSSLRISLHKVCTSLCSVSHMVIGNTGVAVHFLFHEWLVFFFFLSSFYNHCAASLRIPAQSARRLCALTFYWILPSLLRSLATIFPQPGTFLPLQLQVFWRGFLCPDTHAEWDVP